MKNIYIILCFVLISNLSYSQNPKGIWDLIDESGYIVVGSVQRIDTLLPEKHKHFDLKRNLAIVSVEDHVKGIIDADSFKLHYYTTGGSHTYPAKPEINKKYLFFLSYDFEKECYVLPSKRFSLINFSKSNEEESIRLVSNILSKPELNPCEYFDLLIENLKDPIFPINIDLYQFAMYNDSLEYKFCIDSLMKDELYEKFTETLNLNILPFLANYREREIDAILIDQIEIQLKAIDESKEMYCIEETSYVIECLRELSFLNSKQANAEIDSLYNNVWMAEHNEFILNTNKLMNKYER